MGKRGMQAEQAMGVAALDPEFLGHHKAKAQNFSINGDNVPPPSRGRSPAPEMPAAMSVPARPADKQAVKNSAFVKQASESLNSRFSDMFKAFQYVDLDRSGTLDEKEIRRALDMWNIPITPETLRELIAACDHDGDGQVDYKEFVDVLARDTVAPAAMGKRGMQAEQAMGVASM